MTPEPMQHRGGGNSSSWARWVNVALGAWLFISAFVWPHSGAAFTNTWIMGIVIAGLALFAAATAGARWVNTAAGAWVFIAAFVLPHASVGTVWNNAIVGALVVLLSFVPNAQMSRNATARV